MILELLFWILFGCATGIFTGLFPGIHVNTIAAIALLFPLENPLGLALMIASMSIVHSFVDFVPSILLGAPEESTFLSVLPGHRMLLKGEGLLAIKLAASGALLSGIISICFSPIFVLFVKKSTEIFPKIMPYALVLVLVLMLAEEKTMQKKAWAAIIIFLSGMLGIIALGEKSTVQNALFVCIAGFFGISTIIESLRKKSFFPKQNNKPKHIGKKTLAEAGLLGFLAGGLVSIVPGIGSNQSAFIIKKIFGNMGTRKFLILLGGSNSSNMILGFLVWFAWGKTRSGSSVAISQLITAGTENILLIGIACLIALGIGFIAAIKTAEFFIKKMQGIDYKKINLLIFGILVFLASILSNLFGIMALATASAIGLLAVSKGIKRTHCMAFLMIPALSFYLGF